MYRVAVFGSNKFTELPAHTELNTTRAVAIEDAAASPQTVLMMERRDKNGNWISSGKMRVMGSNLFVGKGREDAKDKVDSFHAVIQTNNAGTKQVMLHHSYSDYVAPHAQGPVPTHGPVPSSSEAMKKKKKKKTRGGSMRDMMNVLRSARSASASAASRSNKSKRSSSSSSSSSTSSSGKKDEICDVFADKKGKGKKGKGGRGGGKKGKEFRLPWEDEKLGNDPRKQMEVMKQMEAMRRAAEEFYSAKYANTK